MNISNILLLIIFATLSAKSFASDSQAKMCSEINSFFFDQKAVKLHDPSRFPTLAENTSIKEANLELIQHTDYGTGLTIVDIDNDHKEDLLAWNIDGTGRFVTGGVYKIDKHRIAAGSKPIYLLDLGVLNEPRVIRMHDINYLAYTPTGSYSDLIITQVKKENNEYQQHIVCKMQTVIHAESKCRHPACKALAKTIDDEKENNLFKEVLWPHKYFAEAGSAIFYPENGSSGDFDNSGDPTTIWRIGREGYIYQHVYWGLLGQGNEFPQVDSESRPMSESGVFDRHVLPRDEHARLRRVLDEQSKVLSTELHQNIILPKIGQFFLFDANNRTYWGWDLGQRFGEQIYITYTNTKKSDYIGALSIKRNTTLKACSGDCIARSDY